MNRRTWISWRNFGRAALGRFVPVVVVALSTVTAGMAQAVREIPNAMAAHTRFIIVITAAFLAWAVSFSITQKKDRDAGRRERQALLERKEALLDAITELETGHDSGGIPDGRYKSRMRSLRNELAGILERLERSRAKESKR